MSRIRLYDTIIAEMHRSAETEVVSLLLSTRLLLLFNESFYPHNKVVLPLLVLCLMSHLHA